VFRPEQRVHLAIVQVLPPKLCVGLEQTSEAPNVVRAEPAVGQLAEEPIKLTSLV
jgi:hypothetical protein